MSTTQHAADRQNGVEEKKRKQFIANDKARRMSVAAGKFAIPDNKELYKKRYATGIPVLDRALGGGLTAGLHYLGAISSLGKSTLALQIAEHIADHPDGLPVIFFSLEMGLLDITAKSVSRQTYLDTPDRPNLAKQSDMLLNEQIAASFSEAEWQIITAAATKVEQNTRNLTVIECDDTTCTVDRILAYIKAYISAFASKPFVVIDYLQILDAPAHLCGASDKQVADYNVKFLKRMSVMLDIPILLISSFNRDNYDTEANFKAFKESGNIEYTADTLMGLHLAGAGKPNFKADDAKKKYPREVELRILKQRYRPSGQRIPLRFYTRFNYFEINDGVWESLSPEEKILFDMENQPTLKDEKSKSEHNFIQQTLAL